MWQGNCLASTMQFPNVRSPGPLPRGGQEQVRGFWEHVHGFRMDSIARASRREVEVGALGAGPVVTTPCLVKELDLMTCGKADLGVSSNFYMKVTRKDYVTALIAYFDVTFTHGRERVVLATGARTPPPTGSRGCSTCRRPSLRRRGTPSRGLS